MINFISQMVVLKGFRSVFLTIVHLRVLWKYNNNAIAIGKLTARANNLFTLFHVSYSNLFHLIIINSVFKVYLELLQYLLCKLNLEISLRKYDDKKVKIL